MTTRVPPDEKCLDCGGSGVWVMGPITNGVPARSGECYRCKGKGYQTAADVRRNRYYDNKIRRIHA